MTLDELEAYIEERDTVHRDVKSGTLTERERILLRTVKMMEEMGELDWQEKIRHLIEDSVRKERRQFLLARAKQAHRDQPAGPPAAAMIREDRDAR